ncbi:type IV toxin-antitoxin system AbiEi family antitoxin domain-containing protein [Patulibacter sp. NPDC049589]|uniref:type IV toxin-antitoxin system AbiEi family antitoxin domain-containing protein n=1 Tax=Patulibacter sp. NPDC049589 TaxID=3154731 RepID=UPI00342DD648
MPERTPSIASVPEPMRPDPHGPWGRDTGPSGDGERNAPRGSRPDVHTRIAWDTEIARLAHAQHGVVSTAQLLAAGLTTRAIGTRVRRGQLHRIHRGVYAVGHRLLSPRGWWMAAVLAGGDGSLLSHRAAAALWGLIDGSPYVVDVVTLRREPTAKTVRAHRVRSIPPDDRAVRAGIACTSVARTLLDLATVVSTQALDRALRRAEDRRLFDRIAIEAVLRRGWRGSVALRSAVYSFAAEHAERVALKRELERRFRELLRRHRFVLPVTNVAVDTPWGTYVVDTLWPDVRAVIEVDGWDSHQDRESFRRDHARGAELGAAGYHFTRLTWQQVVDEEAKTVEMLRRLIPSLDGRTPVPRHPLPGRAGVGPGVGGAGPASASSGR